MKPEAGREVIRMFGVVLSLYANRAAALAKRMSTAGIVTPYSPRYPTPSARGSP